MTEPVGGALNPERPPERVIGGLGSVTIVAGSMLGIGIFLVHVVNIIGGYHRNTQLSGYIDGAFGYHPLQFHSVIHDFDKKSITENTLKPLSNFNRLVQVVIITMPVE